MRAERHTLSPSTTSHVVFEKLREKLLGVNNCVPSSRRCSQKKHTGVKDRHLRWEWGWLRTSFASSPFSCIVSANYSCDDESPSVTLSRIRWQFQDGRASTLTHLHFLMTRKMHSNDRSSCFFVAEVFYASTSQESSSYLERTFKSTICPRMQLNSES